MRLVLGTHHFSSLGGSETYLLTVAEQLQRLGHQVTVFASEVGEMAQVAHARGVVVSANLAALPAECDALVSQDAVSALALTERYPRQPLVFVVHGTGRELMAPPQLAGTVSTVVVMNDRVARRVAGLSRDHEILRLRQPIDVDRFNPRGAIRPRPRTLLLLGNNLRGLRKDMIASVCEELGLECVQVGRHGNADTEPEIAINRADIVMGYGRSVLEGMACARAAYVFDHLGGDGWVTPERYPALEADGFGGRAEPEPINRRRLREDLLGYTPEMGLENRDLVVHQHDASRHAQELSVALKRLAPRAPVDAPLGEMARLVRLQWQSDSRAGMLAVENAILVEERERERSVAAEQAGSLVERSRREREELERHIGKLEREMRDLKSTRRYRLAGALARPLDRLRTRLG